MLFYEAMKHPKKDLVGNTRRPSDANPISPITSDGDKLSQLQVQDKLIPNVLSYTCTQMYVEISAGQKIHQAQLPCIA
jgi:hypothetical protein